MRIYIAGPISVVGPPTYNYPSFRAAASAWRTLGWDVLDPSERFEGRTDLPYAVYLNHSMIDVIACDAVAVLPGWEASPGATLEVLYARTVGKPVYLAQYPAGGGSSGLRPAAGGVWAPSGELQQNGPAVVGVPGAACACGGDCGGCGADDGASQDGATDGVAGPQGQRDGSGGVRSDVREGDETGRLTDAPQEDFMASVCRRCLRPRNEHEPFALPSEWGSCEEFIK